MSAVKTNERDGELRKDLTYLCLQNMQSCGLVTLFNHS